MAFQSNCWSKLLVFFSGLLLIEWWLQTNDQKKRNACRKKIDDYSGKEYEKELGILFLEKNYREKIELKEKNKLNYNCISAKRKEKKTIWH